MTKTLSLITALFISVQAMAAHHETCQKDGKKVEAANAKACKTAGGTWGEHKEAAHDDEMHEDMGEEMTEEKAPAPTKKK